VSKAWAARHAPAWLREETGEAEGDEAVVSAD
jgi:hypothetical protein